MDKSQCDDIFNDQLCRVGVIGFDEEGQNSQLEYELSLIEFKVVPN